MLQLKNIVKNYAAGDNTVRALRGVSLQFRKNEFVSILGPSGCGPVKSGQTTAIASEAWQSID